MRFWRVWPRSSAVLDLASGRSPIYFRAFRSRLNRAFSCRAFRATRRVPFIGPRYTTGTSTHQSPTGACRAGGPPIRGIMLTTSLRGPGDRRKPGTTSPADRNGQSKVIRLRQVRGDSHDRREVRYRVRGRQHQGTPREVRSAHQRANPMRFLREGPWNQLVQPCRQGVLFPLFPRSVLDSLPECPG